MMFYHFIFDDLISSKTDLDILIKRSFISLIFISLLVGQSKCSKKKVLVPVYKEAVTPEDILPVTDSLVEPVVYTKVPSFEKLRAEQQKIKFIDLILPSILVVRNQIEADRKKIKDYMEKVGKDKRLRREDSVFINEMKYLYKADNLEDLYNRMKPHPVSIALAQAAVESGWGSSRFFLDANNVFGIWSYDPSEKRMKARESSSENPVYVRKYINIMGSIRDYFRLLGSARAYRKFREERLKTDDPLKLIPYLKSYSEKRSEYTLMLKNIIMQNNLQKYDSYRLNPEYFKEPDEAVIQ